MITNLFRELSLLTHAIHESNAIRKQEFEWHKSHSNFATKQDLIEMERRIIMEIQEAIDVLNTLSTAADTFSLRADNVERDIKALIAGLKGATLTPAQAALVEKARASTVALAAAGDKTDAAVAAADAVLPNPAPAGSV